MIIGTPVDEEVRLSKARELGIDTVLNVAESDPLEVVRDLTGGLGADVVAECSGAAPAIASGIGLLRKLGKEIRDTELWQHVLVEAHGHDDHFHLRLQPPSPEKDAEALAELRSLPRASDIAGHP